MENLVNKFLKECVCAGQCSANGIAAFTPEHPISLENKEPEKLKESIDVSDTWAADYCSQEEFDELYQKAKRIMSKAVREIGGEIQLTITEEEEERMVDAILEEVIFSPRTDFFY